MLKLNRKQTVIALVTAGILAAGVAGAAFATKDSEEHNASKAELTAVLAATTAPVDAIHAAEMKAGGRAIEFGLENRARSVAYEVQVISGNGLSKVAVDPTTGVATILPDAGDKPDAARSPAMKTTLGAAVAAAEAQAGGRALEASADKANGNPVFSVSVAKASGEIQLVTVSGADAHVLKMAKLGAEKGGDENDPDAD